MPTRIGSTSMHPPSAPRTAIPLPWRAAYARGRGAHPALKLAPEAFAAASAEMDAPRAAGDYYLARACDAGVDGAWERLEARFRRPLRRFLRRRGAAPAEAEQILDETWGRLATPPARGGGRTRIGTYDGRGGLQSWLATVTWRHLADRWRARTRMSDAEEEVRLAGSRRQDPSLSVSQAETARVLGRSLEDAWSQLTVRELEAVVLKYRHRLPQTEIARILRVGAPRVTRMLQSATKRLRQAIVARFDRHSDWEAGGRGWDDLLATVESMLTRTEVDVDARDREGGANG